MQISECATDAKTMAVTRTHFTFPIDLWTPDGESIVEPICAVWSCCRDRIPSFHDVLPLNCRTPASRGRRLLAVAFRRRWSGFGQIGSTFGGVGNGLLDGGSTMMTGRTADCP